MKAEKIVLSFVAVLVGLIAAGGAFYLYQATKIVSGENNDPLEAINPSPAENNNDYLFIIDSPKDEEVFDKRSINIKGKTLPGTTIIASSDDIDEIVTPAENGNFTLTMSIPEGTSVLNFAAIFPDGNEKIIKKTVTFTTEDF